MGRAHWNKNFSIDHILEYNYSNMKIIYNNTYQDSEILNNHFGIIFTSENRNNVPEFNLSYRKKTFQNK